MVSWRGEANRANARRLTGGAWRAASETHAGPRSRLTALPSTNLLPNLAGLVAPSSNGPRPRRLSPTVATRDSTINGRPLPKAPSSADIHRSLKAFSPASCAPTSQLEYYHAVALLPTTALLNPPNTSDHIATGPPTSCTTTLCASAIRIQDFAISTASHIEIIYPDLGRSRMRTSIALPDASIFPRWRSTRSPSARDGSGLRCDGQEFCHSNAE